MNNNIASDTYSAGFTCMPDRLKPGSSNYGGFPTIVCNIFATVIGLSYIIMSGWLNELGRWI